MMMKRIALLLTVVACYSCNQPDQSAATTAAEAPDLVAQEAVTIDSVKTFGAPVVEENVISTTLLQQELAGKDSVQATVSAEILESCKSKGCWANIKMEDNSTMKVTFKDYAFFLPTNDLAGREVVFTGTAKRQFTSVEDQQHYAKDAGKSEEEINAITTPKEEIRFVADGITLK